MKLNIACLEGDGIGPEIMKSAVQVLRTVADIYQHEFNFTTNLFGGHAIDVTGTSLPNETLKNCLSSDAVLLAAVGGPKWDHGTERPEKGLLKLRKELNLFANIRPVDVYDELINHSPLKPDRVKDVSFVVVRELTGGIYFSEPRFHDENNATDTLSYSREEIERIVTYAFVLAQTRKGKLTSVDKANVLESSKLWRKIVNEISVNYPEVEVEHLLVDAAAMEIIRNPKRFDVIVTENLFGDILSDEASMITGSLGMLPSASRSGNGPSLYEPIHGSAPDIAGLNKANPIAMLKSVSMMLRDFKLTEEANTIENAIVNTFNNGYLTGDLGGDSSTTEFTSKVIDHIQSIAVGGVNR
ncbi:3-isopropylmalate dehydrogenase [Bacillus sp. EAC]|uniref:3-isopropylmalate dehydrogenase n=1 Tax=Bacillus sp. EAC TaxID=1978338 RepID=UPI000B44013F|nr:3-isopropylmalate dehydrogenase [Bacillus sp. EAC]